MNKSEKITTLIDLVGLDFTLEAYLESYEYSNAPEGDAERDRRIYKLKNIDEVKSRVMSKIIEALDELDDERLETLINHWDEKSMEEIWQAMMQVVEDETLVIAEEQADIAECEK